MDGVDAEPGPESDPPPDQMIGRALGLDRYSRHVLLCTGPNCCSKLRGDETWSYLRNRLKELERRGRLPPVAVYQTRVDCLRICRNGPILVVYPEAVWYQGVDSQVCERIITDHLLGGRIVESHAFARNENFGK